MIITHTITRDDQEIEIEVEINYHPGMNGSRDAYGQPLEPDDEPEAEIIRVTPDIELEENEIDAITEKAFDQAADDYLCRNERDGD